MPAPSSPESPSKRLLPKVVWIAWGILASLGLIAIIATRNRAIDGDFAIANQVTFGIGLLIGILTIFAFFASGRVRLGIYCLAFCGLALGLFFSLFRWERLDGELKPRFSWRWQEMPVLPTVSDSGSIPEDTLSQLILPQSTDSAQFLGPDRNATWSDWVLETDWQTSPPQILWKQPIGEGWSSFAIQGDVGVTMEQRDDQEWVSAYDIRNGQMLWKHVMQGRYASPVAGNGPRSTPAIQENRVFASSAISQFVCLDLKDGQLLWSQDLNSLAETNQTEMEKEVNWGRAASPLTYSHAVVIPLGGTNDQRDSLIAFDQATGAELWRSGGEQISYSSPALATFSGQEQLLYVSAQSISGFLPNDGKLLWRVQFKGLSPSPNVAQPISLDAEHLFFSKGYGIGSQLVHLSPNSQDGPSEAEGQWNARIVEQNSSVMRTKFTNPVVFNQSIYGLSDGILECIDSASLKRLWKRGRYHQGQLLRLGQHLLVFAEDGRLIALNADPSAHQELAVFQALDNVCWNLPALSGDRLLVRNANEAACIRLPTPLDLHLAPPSN
jgi:outer membrane protein assembly factor BamB